MTIKKVWVVECITDGPLMDNDGHSIEFKSEAAALKRATSMVVDGGQEQVLVYVMTHVVSRPEAPAEVRKVG